MAVFGSGRITMNGQNRERQLLAWRSNYSLKKDSCLGKKMSGCHQADPCRLSPFINTKQKASGWPGGRGQAAGDHFRSLAVGLLLSFDVLQYVCQVTHFILP
jgi:hypothetical protein